VHLRQQRVRYPVQRTRHIHVRPRRIRTERSPTRPRLPIGCSIDQRRKPRCRKRVQSRCRQRKRCALETIGTAAAPTRSIRTCIYRARVVQLRQQRQSLRRRRGLFDAQRESRRTPKRRKKIQNYLAGFSLGWPAGHVQWDGKYITISVENVIYRLSFSGSKASVVGSTQLPAYWNLRGYSSSGLGRTRLKTAN